MTIQRMDHVGIVVDDLSAAIEFFVALGLEPRGEGTVDGRWTGACDRSHGRDKSDASARPAATWKASGK